MIMTSHIDMFVYIVIIRVETHFVFYLVCLHYQSTFLRHTLMIVIMLISMEEMLCSVCTSHDPTTRVHYYWQTWLAYKEVYIRRAYPLFNRLKCFKRKQIKCSCRFKWLFVASVGTSPPIKTTNLLTYPPIKTTNLLTYPLYVIP